MCTPGLAHACTFDLQSAADALSPGVGWEAGGSPESGYPPVPLVMPELIREAAVSAWFSEQWRSWSRHSFPSAWHIPACARKAANQSERAGRAYRSLWPTSFVSQAVSFLNWCAWVLYAGEISDHAF